MEQITKNTQYIQHDVKDLRELLHILMKQKIMIFLLTLLATLGAVGYIMTVKPVYSGSVTIEVGQVVDDQFSEGEYSSLGIRDLDNVNNLKNIVSNKFGVRVSIIKSTTLLTYTATNTNKDVIKDKLNKAVDYTLKRHKEKAKLYSGLHSKVKMTQLVGDITVGDTAIKPKKKSIIIVGFITGLIFSIFLAFFLEFIGGMKKDDNQ